MQTEQLFDDWPERYDRWFQTPIGKLVIEYEREAVLDILRPMPGESILDAGCGTGLFTLDFLRSGAAVTGLELSLPMLNGACRRAGRYPFQGIQGNMIGLPFKNACFDKAVSITALEFIEDAEGAVLELFRVTRSGGLVVVATLNSLSPWAERRKAKTQRGEKHILESAFFRSPDEMCALIPSPTIARTVIHFNKDEDPLRARDLEREGQKRGLNTGAFVVISARRP